MGNYVVFGGELFNKGAQSMFFIVVDEVAKRFPGSKVVLISTRDYGRNEEEKNNYRFQIVQSPSLKQKIKMFLRATPLKKGENCQKLIELFSDADGVIDISGYALGSNWGVERSIAYLTRIMLAKSFRVPIWLFPQSFGPFQYHGIKGLIFMLLAKRYLPYAKKIMAREYEGEKMLEQSFHLGNVVKTTDMVLQNTGIDMRNIYKHQPIQRDFTIQRNSIALIPNTKNNAYGRKDEVLESYSRIIDNLLELGKSIYLIYHSSQDYDLCKEIKSKYIDCSQVILMEEELSCIEYDKVIQRFDYIIASRYHSIVHAYRRGVPAIILGWATKYRELAESVYQSNYVFDVRGKINNDKLVDCIIQMNKDYIKESNTIKKYLEKIQKENVFDYLLEE